MKLAAVILSLILAGCASTSVVVPPPVPSVVTVKWTSPRKLTNGSQLTDLVGYQVSWYELGGVLQQKQVGAVTSTQLTVLPGDWEFYVQAISKSAGVGLRSQVVSKVVQ